MVLIKPVVAAVMAAITLLSAVSFAHAQGVSAELDRPFELTFSQQALIQSENISVGFIDLIEDSRCPSDVVCIRAGQATIRVSIKVDGQDAGQPTLTVGAGEAKAYATFGRYSIRLVGLEPYPVSTVQTDRSDYVAGLVVSKLAANSAGVFVKAAGKSDADKIAVVSGWNLERGKGTLVMLTRDEVTKVAIARFIPSIAQCNKTDTMECIDGQVAQVAGKGFGVGDTIHMEMSGDLLILSAAGAEYTLDIKGIWTRQNGPTVELAEGDRSGPLLVQEIGPDYVSGLNFPEYPVAVSEGLPITLHVGESASNGCTITLTLLEIREDTAVFSRSVDYDRPCPICFHTS